MSRLHHKISRKNSYDIQNNFLTLLLTQMKNQDPTNPMQNNKLTSQLVQINTV
ncbi:MAG: flagellar hook capping FlgD N-terminal domain-containing protein [Arsenophonus endosymbiont of Dermacentor nuttalli]